MFTCTILESKYSKKIYSVNLELLDILKNPLDKPKDKLPLFSITTLCVSPGIRSEATYSVISALILDYDKIGRAHV
jgi:hypothetical protein